MGFGHFDFYGMLSVGQMFGQGIQVEAVGFRCRVRHVFQMLIYPFKEINDNFSHQAVAEIVRVQIILGDVTACKGTVQNFFIQARFHAYTGDMVRPADLQVLFLGILSVVIPHAVYGQDGGAGFTFV